MTRVSVCRVFIAFIAAHIIVPHTLTQSNHFIPNWAVQTILILHISQKWQRSFSSVSPNRRPPPLHFAWKVVRRTLLCRDTFHASGGGGQQRSAYRGIRRVDKQAPNPKPHSPSRFSLFAPRPRQSLWHARGCCVLEALGYQRSRCWTRCDRGKRTPCWASPSSSSNCTFHRDERASRHAGPLSGFSILDVLSLQINMQVGLKCLSGFHPVSCQDKVSASKHSRKQSFKIEGTLYESGRLLNGLRMDVINQPWCTASPKQFKLGLPVTSIARWLGCGKLDLISQQHALTGR